MTTRGDHWLEDSEGSDTVEKRIIVLHYVLLVLSLAMVATSLIALHELSQIMSGF
jgi:hypothetical protein